jgi:sterol desaturase/sphingolipid hydroxylase (fatty acid hydroxylase superfamily)
MGVDVLQRNKSGLRGAFTVTAFGYLLAVAVAVWFGPHLLPADLTVRVLGKTMTARDLAGKLAAMGLTPLLLVPAIFIAEFVKVGWQESSLRQVLVKPSASVLSDVVVYVLREVQIFKLLVLVFSLGVTLISASWLRERVSAWTGVSLDVAGLPLAVQLVALFAVYSFFDYWNHRVDHMPRFWPLHRYHHAAKDFCILNSCRVHPAAFTGIINTCLPVILLGGSAKAFVTLGLLVSTLRFVIHSRIDSDFGWAGRWLVQSPLHHRLHHVLDISDGVGNFSLAPIWDRMFGTWRELPEPGWEIGVEAPYRHGALISADIWRDYAEFWRGLFQPVAAFARKRPAMAPAGETADA